MKKYHVLSDVIGALMLSFATIITMFQIVNRFFTTLYGALFIVAGLISAIICLFINKKNKRNMRIASIACNSIAIGSIIGVLFQLLGYSLTIFESIIIAAIFLGIIFLIYYFFYQYDSRVFPGIIGATLLVAANIIYWYIIFPIVPANYNVYIVMFGVTTIIHFIIALIVVCSDKKTIIDGMSYGYFGLTFAILIVAGIFLLLAADGDVDLDIDFGTSGGKKGNSKSSKSGRKISAKSQSNKSIHKTSNKVKSNMPLHKSVSGSKLSSITNAVNTIGDISIPLESSGIDYVDFLIQNPNQILEDAVYVAYLGNQIDNIKVGQVRELNELEIQYREGLLTLKEYENKLDKYK